MRYTRSSPSTATPATSRCTYPVGSCSHPSTTAYSIVPNCAMRSSLVAQLFPAQRYDGLASPPQRRTPAAARRVPAPWTSVVAACGSLCASTNARERGEDMQTLLCHITIGNAPPEEGCASCVLL